VVLQAGEGFAAAEVALEKTSHGAMRAVRFGDALRGRCSAP
jgi:hypothetical protein